MFKAYISAQCEINGLRPLTARGGCTRSSVDTALRVVVVAGEGGVSVVHLGVDVVVVGRVLRVGEISGRRRPLNNAVLHGRSGWRIGNSLSFNVSSDAAAQDSVDAAKVLQKVSLTGNGVTPQRVGSCHSCVNDSRYVDSSTS